MIARIRWLIALGASVAMSACATGIDAGGETLGENGGVAWILMSGMLVGVGGLLWWIIGRDE
jgi:hypothetical protein